MSMSINELRKIVRDNEKFGDLELCLKWHRKLWDFLSTIENPQCLDGEDLKFATFFNSTKVRQDLLKEFVTILSSTLNPTNKTKPLSILPTILLSTITLEFKLL